MLLPSIPSLAAPQCWHSKTLYYFYFIFIVVTGKVEVVVHHHWITETVGCCSECANSGPAPLALRRFRQVASDRTAAAGEIARLQAALDAKAVPAETSGGGPAEAELVEELAQAVR